MMSSLFLSRGANRSSQEAPPIMDRELSIKLILLGEAGCGKTSLALRFSADEFRVYSEPTIGASFFETSMTYEDEEEEDTTPSSETEEVVRRRRNNTVDFKIWDTAGQEKYHALAKMYYRGADAALLVFDISRASSFKTLQGWVEELKEKGPPDIIMVICGNKLDLDASGDRQVLQQDAEAYATEIGAGYVEASAKDGTNVRELFLQVAKKMPTLLPENNSSEDAGETTINLAARRSVYASVTGCCRS